MNPYAIPSIIAFSSLIILGLATVLHNPRDKLNLLLFALCLNLAFVTGTASMLHLSSSETEANIRHISKYIDPKLQIRYLMANLQPNSLTIEQS